MVVPGSQAIKREAEAEGFDQILLMPGLSGGSRDARCAWG